MDYTSIHYKLLKAVNAGEVDQAEQLLRDGANPGFIVNGPYSYARLSPTSPFHEACFRVNIDMIELMLNYGANPNETCGNDGDEEYAPINDVFQMPCCDVISAELNHKIYRATKLLVKHGLDIGRKIRGKTLYQIAKDKSLSATRLVKQRKISDKLSLKEFVYVTSLKRIPIVCKEIKLKAGNMGSRILLLKYKRGSNATINIDNVDEDIRDYLGIYFEEDLYKIDTYREFLYA